MPFYRTTLTVPQTEAINAILAARDAIRVAINELDENFGVRKSEAKEAIDAALSLHVIPRLALFQTTLADGEGEAPGA